MSFTKYSFAVTLLLYTSIATATIIHIPQDQPTIQAGIDAAIDGDTVLVDTGRYVENINFNGKNIVVGSLFLTTGEKHYISQTVIDGDYSGSAVILSSNEGPEAVLSGFTVTHGRAFLGGGILLHISRPTLSDLIIVENSTTFGGGIYCYGKPTLRNITLDRNSANQGGGIFLRDSSPMLSSIIIQNNSASSKGGGICARYSSPTLSNVTITRNSSYLGGGIYVSSNADIIFDDVRSDIFQNYAAAGSDLFSDAHSTINVVVDTFTVINPTDYHASPPGKFTFDILNAKIEQVTSDLFVSPDGSDDNSGLDHNHPLKTINSALSIIYADSSHPRSINLSSGTYRPSVSGERYPLNCVSYVSLIGKGPGRTILDAQERTGVISLYYNNYLQIMNMSILDGMSDIGGGIYCFESSPILNNLHIHGNHAQYNGGGVACMYGSNPFFRNVTITGNSAESGAGIYCYGSTPEFQNVMISANLSRYDGGGIWCEISSPLLTNVTLSMNQTGEIGGGMGCANGSHPVMVNTISWGNGPVGIYLSQSDMEALPCSVTISYSNVEGGKNGLISNDAMINWLDGNVDADPFFVDPENGDFHLQDSSPCIDAGTAFFVWEGDTIVNFPDTVYDGDAPDMGAFESPYSLDIISKDAIPIKFSLQQNYPNPFNPTTTIEFSIPKSGIVTLSVYDVLGREVETILNKHMQAGHHKVEWKASNVPSGIYFIKMQTGSFSQVRKVMVVR